VGFGEFVAIGKRLWQNDSLAAAFQLLRRPAGDMLDAWFESDPIKAVLGFDAVVGNLASPYGAGSAYVLLHHVFGEVNGKPASLFCQHVAPEFTDGSTWDAHRETVADLTIDTVEAHAPGFKQSVIARQSLSPFDLERMFGLPRGDIFHGAMTLDQLFSARPMLGFADYRMPSRGSICAVREGIQAGHNAAQAVIADLLRD
jgi:phytoene dehydrogenase-like protein